MRVLKFKENALRNNGNAFMPQNAIYYLTYRCNLKCSYCFQRKQYEQNINSYKEISFMEIKRSFSSMEFKSLFLTGGEIFLRDDIRDIIEFFSEKTEKLSLFTNGTMLNEKDIELIHALDNIDIWFSIDGLYEINDYNRGEGTFSKVIENIKKLKNKKIYINTVINEKNIDYLDLFYEFANENGIESLTFQFPMWYEQCCDFDKKYGFDYYTGMQGTYDLEFIRKLRSQIDSLEKHRNYKTSYRFNPAIFCDNIDDYINGSIREKTKLICSDLLEPKLKILPNGDIVICEAFKTKIGNIAEDCLENIWNNEQASQIRKILINNNLTEMCSRCCSINYSNKG